MSVIYKSKILLKTGYGYPGNILDLGEFGYDVSNNKAWAGNGIGNPPTGIVMDPSLNYLWDIVNNLEASTGNYATQIYVDGSLASRDLSINVLFSENYIQDASISWLRQYQIIQDASILAFELNDVTFAYVDGSLAARDASITNLYTITQNLDSSLDLYVLKSGDTMSGNLVIQTDLSVNGKGTFGELNVSGSSFPVSPTAGDMFYRPDLVQMFLYDASRGKWLSIDRATYTSGVESALSSTTTYMSVGDGDMSSIDGFRMPKNGTLLGSTIQNRITVTQPRTMSIRVNDVSAYALTFSSGLGTTGNNANSNFNKDDIVQVAIELGGETLRDVITSFEVAWRE